MSNSDLVGITAAAAALGVGKSTVSRYVAAHPDLVRGRSRRGGPLVDLEELRRHRAANLDRSKVGNHLGLAAKDAGGETPSDQSPGQAAEAPRTLDYARSNAEYKAAQASLAQLLLAEETGRVVPRDEIADATFALGQKLRELMLGREQQLADELAGIADPREVRQRIHAADRALLEMMSESLAALAEEHESDVAA